MPLNETIISVEKIICPKNNTPRAGWTCGYNCITIDNKHYTTVNVFNSNRSKCFKDVVKYLQDNNLPHRIEVVYRKWEDTKVFKQYDIKLL